MSSSFVLTPQPHHHVLVVDHHQGGAAAEESSRLIMEAGDCSSPTSWMFLGGPTESPPPPTHQSILRASHSESAHHQEPSNASRRVADGSSDASARNSSESSAGSYRSQDSGFSDSGENWVGRKKVTVLNESSFARSRRLSPSQSVYQQDQQVVVEEEPDFLNGSCSCSQQQRHFTPSPAIGHVPLKSRPVEVTFSVQQQEVIISQSSSSQGCHVATPFCVAALEELGAPTCTSTPKRPNTKGLFRPNLQIDNFQSLNKNALRDTNNNSGGGDESCGRSPNFNLSPRYLLNNNNQSFNHCLRPAGKPALRHYISEVPGRSAAVQVPPKYYTLPKGFKKVSLTPPQAPQLETPKRRYFSPVKSTVDNDSLRQWLHELRQCAEPECLNTLQVKSILNEPMESSWKPLMSKYPNTPSRLSVTVLAIHSVSAPIISIRNIEQRACVISALFSKICKHLELGVFTRVPPLINKLSANIEEFLKEYRESMGKGHKLERHIRAALYNLRRAAEKLDRLLVHWEDEESWREDEPTSPRALVNPNVSLREANQVLEEIVEGVVSIGNMFRLIVDEKLTRDLSSILDTIENGGLPARVGLQSYMTILADGGLHMCRLAASIRTVRGLLVTLLDSKDDYAKLLALRTLAILLCVGDAVRDFDNAGGFEIVTDILADEAMPIGMKHEALSVLAQASDPWLDLETSLTNLGAQIEKIIYVLTQLIPHFKTQQDTFLLVVATISNLTFLETTSLRNLKRHHTIWPLLSAIREYPDYSIFILDHVATVLANMSGVEKCRKSIIAAGGVIALLTFLQQKPSNFKSLPEITACERVQQKSTIAISRLSNEEGIPRLIVDMKGLDRIIQLCRDEKERNYSDGVLIASLATLRKLVTNWDQESVRTLEAEDLIQPRLLDSFLMYSSRQESYV